MQNSSNIIACLGDWFCCVFFYWKKKSEFWAITHYVPGFWPWKLSTHSAALKRQIKPVVLSAWSIWKLARLPKNFFPPFLLSSFLPGLLSEFICRIKWKSIPFMQTFLEQQGYVWSQERRFVRWKPWWWFLPASGLPRPSPPRSNEREDQTALSKPSCHRLAFSKYSALQ